jgi:hypothetical protein
MKAIAAMITSIIIIIEKLLCRACGYAQATGGRESERNGLE